MKRRNFLKSCLGIACVPVTAVLISESKIVEEKDIIIYVSEKQAEHAHTTRGFMKVKYSGKEEVHSGDLMMWCENGTVCKLTHFAGVAK